ncbi:uncharacterized protein LOC124146685 [Haliotis rufescens]|uniref:uncharacterized protein LOC124146685 n=1 Tax=Haliotis rufescens TaxID=6454 RepID=UPI00201EB6A5|nr:uncharacterized protein LOC124146685 [Haliotis rufescens]
MSTSGTDTNIFVECASSSTDESRTHPEKHSSVSGPKICDRSQSWNALDLNNNTDDNDGDDEDDDTEQERTSPSPCSFMQAFVGHRSEYDRQYFEESSYDEETTADFEDSSSDLDVSLYHTDYSADDPDNWSDSFDEEDVEKRKGSNYVWSESEDEYSEDHLTGSSSDLDNCLLVSNDGHWDDEDQLYDSSDGSPLSDVSYHSDCGLEFNRTNADFRVDIHDADKIDTVDTEKCLIPMTKPYPPNATAQPGASGNIQSAVKKNKHISDRSWNILDRLIVARDGAGILRWFELREVSQRMKERAYPILPVNRAAVIGSVVIFDFLIGEGFVIDKKYNTVHECGLRGQFNFLNHMSKIGIDINQSNKKGSTTLHEVARQSNGRADMLKFLISRGANVNQKDLIGRSALYMAVKHGSSMNVLTLLEAGAVLNRSFRYENANYVSDIKSTLGMAICRSLKMTVLIYTAKIMAGDYKHCKELVTAVKGNSVNIVRFLLRKNAQCCSKQRKSLLRYAAKNHNRSVRASMVDLLFRAGYNVNSEEKCIRAHAFHGKDGKALKKKLPLYTSQTRTLQDLSCFKIRQILGASMPATVHKLPLPECLKSVLQLKHL